MILATDGALPTANNYNYLPLNHLVAAILLDCLVFGEQSHGIRRTGCIRCLVNMVATKGEQVDGEHGRARN